MGHLFFSWTYFIFHFIFGIFQSSFQSKTIPSPAVATTMATALTIEEPETNNETNNDDGEKTEENDTKENDANVESNPDEIIKLDTPALLTVEHMRLCKHSFDRLCKEHPTAIGKALSKRQRDNEKLRGVHLAYSEIRFESFAIVLKKIQSKYGGFQEPGGIFYDLGSGLGKAVFGATLLYQWQRCTGVEVLEMLHDGARELADKWDRTKDGLLYLTEGQRQTVIDLMNEDFLHSDLNLSDATLVYMNSTTFEQDMLIKLASKCEKMADHTFVVTHTKRLPSIHFNVMEECRLMQSWGECSVFIHQRKPRDWQEDRRIREEAARKKQQEEEKEEERERMEKEQEKADIAEDKKAAEGAAGKTLDGIDS